MDNSGDALTAIGIIFVAGVLLFFIATLACLIWNDLDVHRNPLLKIASALMLLAGVLTFIWGVLALMMYGFPWLAGFMTVVGVVSAFWFGIEVRRNMR
jgi:hypothetical protein